MQFAILSDVHDNLPQLEKALEQLLQRGIQELVFCGDFCAPFSARLMAQSGLNVHAVFGNNDGDRYQIARIAEEYPRLRLYGEYIGDEGQVLELGGQKFGVTHYPFYAKAMVKTGWYDAVFFGHSHQVHRQKFGPSLLLNPGEIAGLMGPSTYALYETELRSSEIISL
ncbi:MAG: metallophosphoesterase [Bacteroidia bacterium]